MPVDLCLSWRECSKFRKFQVSPDFYFPVHFLISPCSMCTSHIFIQGPAEIWDWLFLVSCEHACSLAPVCILPDRQGCVADYPCPLNSPSKLSGCSAGMSLHPVLNPQDNWEIKLFHLFAFEFAIIFSDALGFGCFPYFSLNHISHLQQGSF